MLNDTLTITVFDPVYMKMRQNIAMLLMSFLSKGPNIAALSGWAHNAERM